ncbi:MAG: FKBP-type peptidyl-prolyl cis-trans isomerase [Armatimonadetes bacterium]|nr:FKBP-type peptidyl-prolyl cis-trans isomerase [Armatimonadota bacterium]
MGSDLIVAFKVGLALMGVQPGVAASKPVDPRAASIQEGGSPVGLPAKPGDRVTVEFVVSTMEGKEIANSAKRGLPYTVAIGDPASNPFWQTALGSCRVGMERKIMFSAENFFGTEGAPPVVPADTPLLGIIRIVRIVRSAAAAPPPSTAQR